MSLPKFSDNLSLSMYFLGYNIRRPLTGNLICSTFEALVVQHAVGRCHGESGPFCWPVPAADIAAEIAVFCASHRFTEHTS